jgi:hypothetical protein
MMASDSDGIAYFHDQNVSFLRQNFYVKELAGKRIAEKYGLTLHPPAQRPRRMRDFALLDPSGVLWRIAKHSLRAGHGPATASAALGARASRPGAGVTSSRHRTRLRTLGRLPLLPVRLHPSGNGAPGDGAHPTTRLHGRRLGRGGATRRRFLGRGNSRPFVHRTDMPTEMKGTTESPIAMRTRQRLGSRRRRGPLHGRP